jgi:2-methylcitrate dehydratase PrpD
LVAAGRAGELPREVVHQACRCLVDMVGVTLGGQRHASVEALLEVCRLVGGHRHATVLGRGVRTSLPLAALVNAQAAHVDDFDDTLMIPDTSLHGGAPIYGAALAVGEWRHARGAEVLASFVHGFEIAARVALALGPGHYAAGWHVTGTAGRFGAAAAAGRLLGLDADRLATALGIVGTQAAGFKAAYGTMAKGLNAARAAHDGVWAALLAARGFTGPVDVLEARFGLLELYTTGPRAEWLDPRAARGYRVLQDGFKPYPCGSLIHAAIDATLAIVERDRPDPAEIVDVEARVNPHVVTTTGRERPATGLEAKFSASHCVAAVLVHGRGVALGDFEDAAVGDRRITALRERVRLRPEAGYPKERAVVAVRLRDGQVLTADVACARGTPGRPLSDAELGAKFLGLAEPVLGRSARRVLDALWAVDTAPDVARLLASVRAPGSAIGARRPTVAGAGRHRPRAPRAGPPPRPRAPGGPRRPRRTR